MQRPGGVSKKAHKQKYRATNAKHWCEYCKTFLPNNDAALKRHEASGQHQDAVRRHIQKIQQEDREKNRLLQEFAQRSGLSLEQQQQQKEASKEAGSFYAKAAAAVAKGERKPPVPMLSVKPPVPRSVSLKRKALPGSLPQLPTENLEQPLDDAKEKEKFVAQTAIVGQWEEVTYKEEQPSAVKKETSLFHHTEETFVPGEKLHSHTLVPDAEANFVRRATPVSRRNIRK